MKLGWLELSASSLNALSRALEGASDGVVDEMGVLTLHTAYADHFFPGTSVLHTRPRYLFFVCWNILSLRGTRRSAVAPQLRKADLWLRDALVATYGGERGKGIIGGTLGPARLPVQRPDSIYWTALERWGFYKFGPSRVQLYRHWDSKRVFREGEHRAPASSERPDEEPLAVLAVPPPPPRWGTSEVKKLDLDLEQDEARFLRDQLKTALADKVLGAAARLAQKAKPSAELPWEDPLLRDAAAAVNEAPRLERAHHAALFAHWIRAVYTAHVERQCASDHGAADLGYVDGLRELAADREGIDLLRSADLQGIARDLGPKANLVLPLLERVRAALDGNRAPGRITDALLSQETLLRWTRIETRRKGARARLPAGNRIRRADFGPDSVTVAPLTYRWSIVRTLLEDLHHGLR